MDHILLTHSTYAERLLQVCVVNNARHVLSAVRAGISIELSRSSVGRTVVIEQSSLEFPVTDSDTIPLLWGPKVQINLESI